MTSTGRKRQRKKLIAKSARTPESHRRSAQERAIAKIQAQGGLVRRKDAPGMGITARTLYSLRDQGIIEQISRGHFRLASAPKLANPDLVTVALRLPQAVICLISALAHYGLTTQVPHSIYVAIPRGTEPPRIDYPPLRTFWFGEQAFREGMMTLTIDHVPVRIYSREKTLADCFKYRDKIGLDVALEALRLYREQKPLDIAALRRYAVICRVEKVMRPYLEALL